MIYCSNKSDVSLNAYFITTYPRGAYLFILSLMFKTLKTLKKVPTARMTDLKTDNLSLTGKISTANAGSNFPVVQLGNLTAEELYAAATRVNSRDIDERSMSAQKDLFTTEVASKYFTPFFIGKEKIKVYGNPITMSIDSPYWYNLKKSGLAEPGEIVHILTEFSVTKYPDQFVMMWLWMNQMVRYCWIYNKWLSLDEIFYIAELMNYFGIELNEEGGDVQDVCNDTILRHIQIELKSWKYLNKERLDWINRIISLSLQCFTRGSKVMGHNMKVVATAALKLPFEKPTEKAEGKDKEENDEGDEEGTVMETVD